jgi:uncharacterized protein (TIGR00251 family)
MIHPALSEHDGALRLAVRVTARAGRDALAGLAETADGRVALAVRLAAPPVEGAANAALIALIAEALGVPRSAVSVATGERSRHKMVRIAGLDARAATLRLQEATAH